MGGRGEETKFQETFSCCVENWANVLIWLWWCLRCVTDDGVLRLCCQLSLCTDCRLLDGTNEMGTAGTNAAGTPTHSFLQTHQKTKVQRMRNEGFKQMPIETESFCTATVHLSTRGINKSINVSLPNADLRLKERNLHRHQDQMQYKTRKHNFVSHSPHMSQNAFQRRPTLWRLSMPNFLQDQTTFT